MGFIFFLCSYGISCFITTCIFYYLVYIGINYIVSFIKSKDLKIIILKNIKLLLFLLLVIEFFMTFIPPFTFMNQDSETKWKIYMSEFKRKKRSELFQKIGIKKVRFTYTDAYLPDSNRMLKNTDYTYVHHYNSIGLRGKLPDIKKNSNEFRIIMLGDSFIEGDGSPDDSTIAQLLENNLNAQKDRIKYTVINGGISGSNIFYAENLYFRKLKRYKPDLVINTVFINDILDVGILKSHGTLPLSEYFVAISHIFRVFYFNIFKISGYEAINDPKRIPPKSEIINKLLIIKKAQDFKKQLVTHKIDVVNLYIPSKEQILNQYPVFNTDSVFDINMYDHLSAQMVDKEKIIRTYYWKHDIHFKPTGYLFTSKVLAKSIKNKYVVPNLNLCIK